jgi:hypothetical protein
MVVRKHAAGGALHGVELAGQHLCPSCLKASGRAGW